MLTYTKYYLKPVEGEIMEKRRDIQKLLVGRRYAIF